MKSEVCNLTNLKRLTAYPYPLCEVGIMINHAAPEKEVLLDRLFVCFSFNKEAYENPSGSDLYPTFSILPPGTLLRRTQRLLHDELFFSYTPEVSEKLTPVLCKDGKNYQHLFYLPDAAFREDLQRLRNLLQDKVTLGTADRIDALAMQMIFNGISTAFPFSPAAPKQPDTGMKIQEIALQLKRGKPLASLLKQYGYSRRSFYYEWNSTFSVTPKQFLITARLERSQKLLISGKLPAAEIAAECGFSSLRYFYECFQKHCNCTPGEYRKRFQGEKCRLRR